jgi:hypothetical protein
MFNLKVAMTNTYLQLRRNAYRHYEELLIELVNLGYAYQIYHKGGVLRASMPRHSPDKPPPRLAWVLSDRVRLKISVI